MTRLNPKSNVWLTHTTTKTSSSCSFCGTTILCFIHNSIFQGHWNNVCLEYKQDLFFLAFAEKTIAAISVVSTVLLSTAYPFGKYDKLSDISYITHSDSWQQSHTCHIQFSYTLKFLVGFSATREPLSVSVFLCGPVYDSCVRCSFRSIHILTHSTK